MEEIKALVGQTVTWTSGAQGTIKKKTGVVLAYVPKGKDIREFYPNPRSQHQMKISNNKSRHDRLLIEVMRFNGKTGERLTSWYYAPIASRFLFSAVIDK